MSWLSWMKHSRWTWALVLATVGSVVLGACSPLPEEEDPDPSGATLATVYSMDEATLILANHIMDDQALNLMPGSFYGGSYTPPNCPGGGTLGVPGAYTADATDLDVNGFGELIVQASNLQLNFTNCQGELNLIDGTIFLSFADSILRVDNSGGGPTNEHWTLSRVETATGSNVTFVRSNGSTYVASFTWSRNGSIEFDFDGSGVNFTSVSQSYALTVNGQTCTRTTTIVSPPSTGWNCN